MLPIKAILLLLVSYFRQFPFPPLVSEISFRAARRKIHVVVPSARGGGDESFLRGCIGRSPRFVVFSPCFAQRGNDMKIFSSRHLESDEEE